MTAYDEIDDWLLVGGDLALAEDLTGQDYQTTVAQLRCQGVSHVLDLRSEWSDPDEWAAGGMPRKNYCRAPIVDLWGYQPPEDWFTTVEGFVRRFWRESYVGDRLLVHCMMGINRGPSAAMLALLTVEPEMHPFDAFLRVRAARPVAGLVYAQPVGERHIAMRGGAPTEFSNMLADYWTPEMRQARQDAKRYLTGAAV